MAETLLRDLVDPEVMGRVINGKLDKAIKIIPFAIIDTTLQGRPGSTVTVPKFGYIGDAVELAEGEAIPERGLEMSTQQYTVMKVGNGVSMTDEAVLSGIGNPVGQATTQLTMSIRSKTDDLAMRALLTAPTVFNGTGVLSYNNVVLANGAFNEETNTEKVMFVHPNQVTDLRLDPLFLSADTYDNKVVMTGEIGMISNTRIAPSRRVVQEDGRFINPIIVLEVAEAETDEDIPALTYYTKRDILTESVRNAGVSTKVVVTKHFVVALTNEEKVVLLRTDALPSV